MFVLIMMLNLTTVNWCEHVRVFYRLFLQRVPMSVRLSDVAYLGGLRHMKLCHMPKLTSLIKEFDDHLMC